MKKLLGAAMALALLFPYGSANAELLKNLKLGGQLSVQANSASNLTDFVTRGAGNNDHLGDTATRVLLNGQWDLLDDVHANVTLRKNDRAWGSAASAGQGAGGSQALGAGGIEAATYVQQANVKIDKVLGHFDSTVGRQYYGDPGDLIIYFGPKNNYGLFVTAVDALRAEASNDWLNFSGLAGKTAGAAIGGAGVTSTDLRGFNIGWKNLPVKANTYLWNAVIHNTGAVGCAGASCGGIGLNDFLWVYGFKVKGEAMGGWGSFELAHNSGENRTVAAGTAVANYAGTAILVDAGYKADIANVGGFTPWVNFGWGSGRGDNASGRNDGFVAIASDYRPGIINGRFNTAGALDLTTKNGTSVSTVGLTNRVVWGFGLKATPAALEKLTVAASFWDYRFQRNTAGAAAFGTGGSAGNRHIGSEFGLTADWKHSDNVTVGAGWADFQPGGFIGNTNRNASATGYNPATLAFADLKISF